jgi:hypothetical protein
MRWSEAAAEEDEEIGKACNAYTIMYDMPPWIGLDYVGLPRK